MQTSNNKKYYEILRNEEAKHRAKMSLKRSEFALPSPAKETWADTAVVDHLLGTTRSHRQYADDEAVTERKPKNKPFPGCPEVEEPRPRKIPQLKTMEESEQFIDPSEGFPKVLDPVEALHLPPHTLRSIYELSFCDKNITALHHNFLLLEHLEVLFLQRNRLSTIEYLMPPAVGRSELPTEQAQETGRAVHFHVVEGQKQRQHRISSADPRGCARLRHLDVSFNLLADLSKTNIPQLAFLEYLHLGGNRLGDLHRVTTTLRRLRFLRSLVLERNPISSLQGYRSFVIYHIPQLTTLDHRTITQAERSEAAQAHTPKVPSPLASTFNRNGTDWTLLRSTAEQPSAQRLHNSQRNPSAPSTARRSAARSPRTIVFGTHYVQPEGGRTPAPPESRHSNADAKSNAASESGKKSTASEGRESKKKMWERSECVQLMERKRLAYLLHKENAARREEAEAEGQLEEVRRAHMGFHGIWSLCAPQMPLSEEEYTAWNDAKKNAKALEEAEEAMSSVSTATSSSKFGKKSSSASAGGQVPPQQTSPASAAPSAALGPSEEVTPLTLPLQKVLPLLPLKAWEAAEALRKESVKAGVAKEIVRTEHAANHQGVLFDAVLHRDKALEHKTVPHPEWRVKSIPTPERLQPMREAIQAAGMIFGDIPVEQEVAIVAPAGSPARSGGVSGSNASSSPAVPPLQLDVDLMRYIHDRKSALVPPPWEHVEMATVLNAMEGELQEQFLRMVRVFFTAQELQALEQQFGTSEVLHALSQGLGAAGTVALNSTASAVHSPGTPSHEREKQHSSRGKRGGSSKRSRNANTSNSSLTNLLLQEQQLLAMMTSPLIPSRRNLLWMGLESPPAKGQGPAAKAAAAAAAAAAHSGVVGSYAARNLDLVLNLLRDDSHANEISSEALLEAICQAHAVDPGTSCCLAGPYVLSDCGTLSPTSANRITLLGSSLNGSVDPLGVAGNNSSAVKEKAGAAANRKRVVMVKNTPPTGESGAVASGTERGAASLVYPSSPFTGSPSTSSYPVTNAGGTGGEKVFLSLNNVLGALLCYLPFVEGRVVFFQEQCMKCAVTEKLKAEAPEWFMRKQQAEMHRDSLLEALQKSQEAPPSLQPPSQGDGMGTPTSPTNDALFYGTTDGTLHLSDPSVTFPVQPGAGPKGNNTPFPGGVPHSPNSRHGAGKLPSGVKGSGSTHSGGGQASPPSGGRNTGASLAGGRGAAAAAAAASMTASLESTSWSETNATLMRVWQEVVRSGPLDTTRVIIPPTALAAKEVQPVGGVLEDYQQKWKSYRKKNSTAHAFSAFDRLEESLSD